MKSRKKGYYDEILQVNTVEGMVVQSCTIV